METCTFPIPAWSLRVVLFNYLGWFFPQTQLVSSHVCDNHCSAEYLKKPLCISKVFLLRTFSSVFRTLLCELFLQGVVNRAYLACFPSLGNHCPLLPMSSVLNVILLYIFFYFFHYLGRRLNLGLFAPSWLETEVPVNYYNHKWLVVNIMDSVELDYNRIPKGTRLDPYNCFWDLPKLGLVLLSFYFQTWKI